MSYSIIYPNGQSSSTEISVVAGAIIAVKSKGDFKVYEIVTDPNVPDQKSLLSSSSNTEYVSAVLDASNATTVIIEAGASEVHYVTGTDAQVLDEGGQRTNYSVGALNATGTLTTALCLGGVVTSTTASAVTATLDTGALTDLGSNFAIGEGFQWSVVVTGATNALTVTAAAGHTVVGEPIVAADSSGLFLTLKTAADTFVTYRLSGV